MWLSENAIRKWSFRLTFKREKQFRNVAIAIEKEKYRINLNKLIYIGTGIIDLSKVLMQDFHFNYIKNKNGDKAEMLLKDTGSLMHKIETENVLEDCCKSKDLFDFCIYPKDSKYYNHSNNVVVNKMKDETSGTPIKRFVGLKSKMYTLITNDNHQSKKAKKIIKMLLMMN